MISVTVWFPLDGLVSHDNVPIAPSEMWGGRT